jgi:hypothetical protein
MSLLDDSTPVSVSKSLASKEAAGIVARWKPLSRRKKISNHKIDARPRRPPTADATSLLSGHQQGRLESVLTNLSHMKALNALSS